MRSTKNLGPLTFLTLLVLLLSPGCKVERPNYPARQMPAGLLKDTEQVNLGQTLFMDKCASCHGKPNEGRSERADFFEPAAPDFTSAHYQQSDPAFLYWRIERGKAVEPYRSQGSVMPAWGLHFSEEQIWQLVAYLQIRAH